MVILDEADSMTTSAQVDIDAFGVLVEFLWLGCLETDNGKTIQKYTFLLDMQLHQ